ncbi:MAG: hypothetical protein GC137_07070 [Alphaproteobacteria bacterium]|nr:hypothetical protein [Alphaproteobacteria bacterium]
MTGISTLGQALRQIENLGSQQIQFATLSEQLATGKKTQFYSGLSTDALTSVRSRVDVSALSIFLNNIQRAETTIGLSLNAIEEFQAQTEQFANALTGFVQEGDHQTGDPVFFDDPGTTAVESTIVGNTSANFDPDLGAIFSQAENLFNFLGDLLNAQEGDRFLFAGADISQRPFKDNGTLDSSLNTLITNWKNGTITTDDLVSDLFDGTALNGNPDAITDSAIGYSAPLSNGTAGKVFIRADEDGEFNNTNLANETALRNIMVALAVFKNENLPPIVDVYEDGVYPGIPDAQGAPGTTAAEQQASFFALFNAISTVVLQSIDDIDQIRFRNETVRVQINETKKSHTDQINFLKTTVSSVEDVDANEVAVQISVARTQLEASYRVTALVQDLTLVNFL